MTSLRCRALLLGVLSFAASLAGQTTPATTVQAPEATFRVGTWNIEFLGAPPQLRRDTPPRNDQDLAAIGRFIASLGVSALAVQEISGEQVLQQVANAAGPNWRALLGTTGAWDDGTTQQGIGFLWDDRVLELLHAEELLDFPREDEGVAVFHRKPVTAAFRHRQSGCDFRLVTVHLKAGQKANDLDKRRREATRLRAWLDELLTAGGEDPDVLLLGDLNSTYGTEPEQVLEAGGLLRYLEPRERAPTILHFDDPIDHVVASSRCVEVEAASLLVHRELAERDRAAFRKTYSDHFPVSVALRARGDDDPDATFRKGPAAHELPVAKRSVRAAAANAAWPPAVGSSVRVVTVHMGEVEGRLAATFPENGQGWILLDVAERRLAVPTTQVVRIELARP